MFQFNRMPFFGAALAVLVSPLVNCQRAPALAPTDCSADQSISVRQLEVSSSNVDIRSQLAPKEVVLTLDDGPHIWRTPEVLDVLDLYCAKATFFLQGDAAQKHPNLVRQIVKRGHSIGSHTFRHPNLTSMELPDALSEVDKGHQAVVEAFASSSESSQTAFFRYPFVASNAALDEAVRARGLKIVSVDVDGADWTRNAPEASTEMIMQKLADRDNRGIILLHDPVSRSDQRVDLLIQSLIENDFALVHLVDVAEE